MSGRLEGKVAIVTGGATGLGRETSLLYAREGAKVVVADIRPEPAQQTVRDIVEAGGEATFVEVNVAREEDLKAAVDAAEHRYGALHIMTANAGTIGRGHRKPITEIAEDEARDAMDINFWGVFYSFRHAVPAIHRAGGGALTATSSTSALRGMGDLGIYSATKGAVSAFVRSVAAEVAPLNIRANSVVAGPMATELHRHWYEDRGLAAPEVIPSYEIDPIRGFGGPIHVAYLHLFLASDEAIYVNGEEYRADGGRSMLTQAAGAR